MTTLKTPKQIAETAADMVLRAHGFYKVEGEGVGTLASDIETLGWKLGECITYERGLVDLVKTAIAMDRKQRAADLQILADAASKWATELTDYVIPSAEESDAADAQRYEAERDAIQAALGRHLAEKEAAR